MNILITGIHGFIGKNLTNALHDHCIYGLSDNSFKGNEVIAIYPWDKLEDLPMIDIVIHLAGKAHDVKNSSDVQVYFDINVELTKKVFNWFMKSEAKKFIFMSSVKAVADSVRDVLVEDVIPEPKGPYGESKLAAEEYIKEYWDCIADLHKKQVYILRACMIHGLGNKGNLNMLYSFVRKGIPWPLGSFYNKRSFLSIENVSYIIKQLVECDINSGIYNLADDIPLSTNEIVQIISNVLCRKCRILHINRNLIIIIAKFGGIFKLPLNQDRLKKLTENYIVSNEKIKKSLGVKDLPLSAREGFVKTIQGFKLNR